jgi:hypothetical protein
VLGHPQIDTLLSTLGGVLLQALADRQASIAPYLRRNRTPVPCSNLANDTLTSGMIGKLDLLIHRMDDRPYREPTSWQDGLPNSNSVTYRVEMYA